MTNIFVTEFSENFISMIKVGLSSAMSNLRQSTTGVSQCINIFIACTVHLQQNFYTLLISVN